MDSDDGNRTYWAEVRNFMIDTILDNVMIVLLTALGVFQSKAPFFLIIVAAVLMIRITSKSFEEETTVQMLIADSITMMIFAVLSGSFTGFSVFFLVKNLKVNLRILLGTVLFLVYRLVFSPGMSIAESLLSTLFLLMVFLSAAGIYGVIEWREKKRENEKRMLLQANISELHEKRLNQQLILRKIADERDARLLERENISRNIHNSVGHSITAAIMALDAADMLYDVRPEEARKRMRAANVRIRGSLESIRRAVRVLDEDNKFLFSKDLKAELRAVAAEFSMDTCIRIFQDHDEMADDILLPDEQAVFLTGVLQEMLTNGVKHGNANEFRVALSGDSAHIRLEITDNGNSDFDAANSGIRIGRGFGLEKIISYAEKCGGKTRFQNENGFQSMVELPVPGETTHGAAEE